MDFGTVLTLAQNILFLLESQRLRDLWSAFGYKSELEELKRTISTVKAVLLDSEAKQDGLTHEAQLYVGELKVAVYDADDLLDEFDILAERKQLMDGGKFAKKVSRLLSRYTQLGVAYNMSQEVKRIKKKLDAIASNHNKFGLSLDHKAIKRRREETCSYVYANDIVGREDDVEMVLGMLLDSSVKPDLSCVSIVGMGGLGKTALAQLVYNDDRVKSVFPLRLWACDGNQDPNHLDMDAVLHKMMASAATDHKHHDEYYSSTMDVVQKKLRGRLAGKRFLLVLDDIWIENRDEWIKLEGFLKEGLRGSRVLVTTQSIDTARIVGNGLMHQLKSLSDGNAWLLFEKMAFQENPSNELAQIGRQIVKRCANVPLAIRAVGSLLYGQEVNRWKSVLDGGLASVMNYGKNGIMPILKWSYDNLETPIKSCFSYCALFPQDYKIKKRMLINLWLAQGYVVPLERGQTLEDAAQDYFLILLRRCFFQDAEKDEDGNIISCKIHDLMHNIAREVSRVEVCEVNSNSTIFNGGVDERVRHVSDLKQEFLNRALKKNTCIRTYLQVGPPRRIDELLVDKLLTNCTRLRTLDLSRSRFESLPDSIGSLLHLRFLDLSSNDRLKVLPESITELYNLIVLEITGCHQLRVLPLGLGKLRHLRSLERFMVGKAKSSEKRCFDELEDLNALDRLKGYLEIYIQVPKCTKSVKEDSRRRGAYEYLSRKDHLDGVDIIFEHKERYEGFDFEEALLQKMRPHPNLRDLELRGYHGLRMPSWATGGNLTTSLPNLVRLFICDFRGLQLLPCLGKLRHLKELRVEELPSLEYMESSYNPAADPKGGRLPLLFPCLEVLELIEMPRLKGWWQGSRSSPRLPHLKAFEITNCPRLSSLPLCPLVEDLAINDVNRSLQLQILQRDSGMFASSSSTLSSGNYPKPRRLAVSNVECLKQMPAEYLQGLAEMEIHDDQKLESLEKCSDLFRCCSLSSLQCLIFTKCHRLTSVCGWLEHLTALDSLRIQDCPNLVNNAQDDGIPWRNLPRLRSLELYDFEDLQNLPKGMQHCTSLESLVVSDCPNLRCLPTWMSNLNSLTNLQLRFCYEKLNERCHNPTGKDWRNIQHIPHISINENCTILDFDDDDSDDFDNVVDDCEHDSDEVDDGFPRATKR